MKVLDLQCAWGHRFEGWFGSESDYQQQRERGLLTCPVCGADEVSKCLSAPRLNLGAQPPAPSAAISADAAPTSPGVSTASLAARQAVRAAAAQAGEPGHAALLHAAWRELVQRVKAHSEDVGHRFAHEARKIHQGEAEERSIHGKATLQEAQALLEEGIAVLPLPPDEVGGKDGALH